MQVMEMFWRLIYSDDRLHAHEDHLVHKLATLLGLDHRYLIEAKLKAKEERAKQQSKGGTAHDP